MSKKVIFEIDAKYAPAIQAWTKIQEEMRSAKREADAVGKATESAGKRGSAGLSAAGNEASKLISSIAGVGAALVGIQQVTQAIRQEFEFIRNYQAGVAEKNVAAAGGWRSAALIFGDMNKGDKDVPDFDAYRQRIVKDVVSQGVPTNTAASVAAASLQASDGQLPIKLTIDNAAVAARLLGPNAAPENLTALASAMSSLQKVDSSLTAEGAAGFLAKALQGSAAENLGTLSQNMMPGLMAMRRMGYGLNESGGTVAAISQISEDKSMLKSSSAAVNMATWLSSAKTLAERQKGEAGEKVKRMSEGGWREYIQTSDDPAAVQLRAKIMESDFAEPGYEHQGKLKALRARADRTYAGLPEFPVEAKTSTAQRGLFDKYGKMIDPTSGRNVKEYISYAGDLLPRDNSEAESIYRQKVGTLEKIPAVKVERFDANLRGGVETDALSKPGAGAKGTLAKYRSEVDAALGQGWLKTKIDELQDTLMAPTDSPESVMDYTLKDLEWKRHLQNLEVMKLREQGFEDAPGYRGDLWRKETGKLRQLDQMRDNLQNLRDQGTAAPAVIAPAANQGASAQSFESLQTSIDKLTGQLAETNRAFKEGQTIAVEDPAGRPMGRTRSRSNSRYLLNKIRDTG